MLLLKLLDNKLNRMQLISKTERETCKSFKMKLDGLPTELYKSIKKLVKSIEKPISHLLQLIEEKN